jgi:hypothetical protein
MMKIIFLGAWDFCAVLCCAVLFCSVLFCSVGGGGEAGSKREGWPDEVESEEGGRKGGRGNACGVLAGGGGAPRDRCADEVR